MDLGHPGRLVPKKGYIGTVSTKTHSGDPDGTGGFGSFLGSGTFLALKFRFYEKFHRQNWLEIVGKQDLGQKKGIYRVVVVLVVPRVGSGTGGPPGGFGWPCPRRRKIELFWGSPDLFSTSCSKF